MAVPDSGNPVSLAGIKAEIDNNAYNASATVITSLETIATETSINSNSSSVPNATAPHAMSEWYGYDHDAAPSFTDDISFDFDGANDYLTRSPISGLETTGSVSAWVKLDSMSANGFIFQIREEEGTNNQIILLWNNAAGVIRGNVKFAGTTNVVDSGSGLENDGNWHHVAFTWMSGSKTSANNITRIYIDGSETDNDAIGNTWNGTAGELVIGRNGIQSNAYFNGHINDVAIFSDALTSSEVTAIYNSGSPKDESSHSGLVAYYTMEAYSDGDTTLADDSTNSNTITITNSTNIDSTDTP